MCQCVIDLPRHWANLALYQDVEGDGQWVLGAELRAVFYFISSFLSFLHLMLGA